MFTLLNLVTHTNYESVPAKRKIMYLQTFAGFLQVDSPMRQNNER